MLNRNDIIEQIVTHAIRLGRYSEFYLSQLQSMSIDSLDEELEKISKKVFEV